MPTEPYEPYLLEDLRDLAYSAGYLSACLEEGEDVFLLGVLDVAKAQGIVGAIATLHKDDGLRLSDLTAILDQLGMGVSFKPKLQGTETV